MPRPDPTADHIATDERGPYTLAQAFESARVSTAGEREGATAQDAISFAPFCFTCDRTAWGLKAEDCRRYGHRLSSPRT